MNRMRNVCARATFVLLYSFPCFLTYLLSLMRRVVITLNTCCSGAAFFRVLWGLELDRRRANSTEVTRRRRGSSTFVYVYVYM
jgi:hypothetical protein